MSYLLRVIVPDRPGVLGSVATALGEVGADILSIDVIERGRGSATDDIVVEVPADRLADSLVSAALGVPGVVVDSIRPYAGKIDAHRELELLDALATTPGRSLPLVTDGVTRIFRAGWALVLASPRAGHARVLAASGAAPERDTLPAPWWPPSPPRVLECAPDWAPSEWGQLGTELAVAPIGDHGLLVGRPALRWRPSELVRLQHLAAIAATVAAR